MATRDLHRPVDTGAALAVAAGVLYAACVALVVAAPAFALRVLAVLVHGLNTAPLAIGAPSLHAVDVIAGLIFWMAMAFVGGAVYATCANAFARRTFRPAHHV